MGSKERIIISTTTINIYSASGSNQPTGTCTTIVYVEK